MKNTLKNVTELSNELDVSRQTIYNKISEIENEIPKNDFHLYFKQKGNTRYLTNQSVRLIYEKLGHEKTSRPNDPVTSKKAYKEKSESLEEENTDPVLEVIKVLEKQLEKKDKQLQEKDDQIQKLLDTINKQQDSLNNQLKADRERNYIKLLEQEEKQTTDKQEPAGENKQQEEEPIKKKEEKGLINRFINFFKSD